MFTLAHVLRSLKHHVLEQMRKTCVTWQLVPGTHVKRDAQRHGRRSVIFREHNAQAVLQCDLLDGNLDAVAGCCFCRLLSRLRGCPRTTCYQPQRQNKSKGATNIEMPHFVLLPEDQTLPLYPNSYWTADGSNSFQPATLRDP